MKLIRLWTLFYLLALVLSVALRLSDSIFDSVSDITVNIVAIVVAALGWLMFEKRKQAGYILLLFLSILRALTAILVGSVFFAFVSAYIPTAPLWSAIIRLPTVSLLGICLVILTFEVFYYRNLQSLFKEGRSPKAGEYK